MNSDIFVEKLSKASPGSSVTNPWKGNSERAMVCRKNLKSYLSYFEANPPSALLVGEALGYKGGLHTGIPFSSMALLNEKNHLEPLRNTYNYSDANISESTATIAWTLFEGTTVLPLCWNAFPFHPHRPFRKNTNRAPRVGEIRYGTRYLHMILEMFFPVTVVAVGNKAAISLEEAGIVFHKIRHPSFGGKSEFCNQFKELVFSGKQIA